MNISEHTTNFEQEMIGYIQKARAIMLRLERVNKIYSTVERIELRKDFNGVIGIYN